MNQSPTDPQRISPAGTQTRDALIQAARAVFSREGFDGASVRTITAEAGTNLGAITYHFGSKRALYETMLEECLRPLLDRVLAAAAGEGTALDRIVAVVEAYFDHLAVHANLPHLLLQEIAAGKAPPETVLEIVGKMKNTIAGLQIEGVADGSVRPGHPTLTALSTVAQPIYMTLVAPLVKTVAGIDLSDEETRGVVMDHATTFVRHALQPGKEAAA